MPPHWKRKEEVILEFTDRQAVQETFLNETGQDLHISEPLILLGDVQQFRPVGNGIILYGHIKVLFQDNVKGLKRFSFVLRTK